MSGLASRWASQFYTTLCDDRTTSDALREASLTLDLSRWTRTLTALVVRSFQQVGLVAAGKGSRCDALPVRRNEYLGQDVMAFQPGEPGWRFPTAVCELENASRSDLVAYSLWKVLCIRCSLRAVFCYRPDPASGPPLVSMLASSVVGAMPIADRAALDGETLVVVGSRNEADTFPYGFFQAWKLNSNTGRFERLARA